MKPIYRHFVDVSEMAGQPGAEGVCVCAETVRDAQSIAFLVVHSGFAGLDDLKPEELIELADRHTVHQGTQQAVIDPADLAQRRGDRKS